MTTAEFMREVFGVPPAGSSIVVWALPDKASRWCESVEMAVKAIDAARAGDVYISVAYQNIREAVIEARRRETEKAKRDGRPERRIVARLTRGFNETAAAITGLFCDIDIKGPGHKHANLPENQTAALKILDGVGVPPTIVVDSGGGLHAWWLFHEPNIFADASERRRAYELSQGWQRLIQRHAVAAGVAIDSTFDLTRVLRVPGTVNRKYDPPRECEVIRSGGPRYNPSDLAEHLDPGDLVEAAKRADAAAEAVPPSPSLSKLILAADASPPAEKFEALLMNDQRFQRTWNRQRKDMGDQSPSAYDMSLANAAVRADWTDQEIINLLIAFRRKYKDDLKLDRLDYYEKFTIAAARKSKQQFESIQEIHHMTNRSPDAPRDQVDDGLRAKILDGVSNSLCTRIRTVIRYKQDPPRFRLVTAKGAIELGTVENLIGQVSFRNAIAASDGQMIPPFSKEDWSAVAQALLDACEDVDTGEESTDEGMMKSWVQRYLDENPPGELSSQLISNQMPYTKQAFSDRVFIFGSAFREWIFRRDTERVTAKQMGILLKRIGGEPMSESHKEAGRMTTRHVWILPKFSKANTNGQKPKAEIP